MPMIVCIPAMVFLLTNLIYVVIARMGHWVISRMTQCRVLINSEDAYVQHIVVYLPYVWAWVELLTKTPA